MLCTALLAMTLGLVNAASPSTAPVVSEGPAPILQPQAYHSRNGRYQLHVNPSRRDGGGPGTYRMTSEGKVLWEKTLPITFWDAVLTDEGRVGGYAFSNGSRDRRAKGSLHLMLLDPQGTPAMDEAIKRVPSRMMHTAPTPRCGQLRLSEDGLDMWVRVIDDEYPRQTIWRAYEIASGRRLPDTKRPTFYSNSKSYERTQARPPTTATDSDSPTPLLLPATRLKSLPVVPLTPRKIQEVSPVRDLIAFSFRGNGAIEFVRGRRDETVHITLSLAGEVRREQPLPNLWPASGKVTWYPGFGDQWFAAVHDYDFPASDQILRVDTSTGTAHPVSFPNIPEIRDVATTPDGGFVVLGKTGRGSSRMNLISVDAAGIVRWRLDEQPGDHKLPDSLFAVSELARTRSGHLVLSSTVKDSAQVFNDNGQFVLFIDLEKSWGHEPHYPGGVIADERGGFCIYDDGKLHRMDLEGTLIEIVSSPGTPELPFATRGARFDSEGTLWAPWINMISSRKSDGSQGAVFGVPPSKGAIQRPNGARVVRTGQILVGDRASQDWCVFSPAGELQLILTIPPPHKSSGTFAIPALGPDGHWFLPLRPARGEYKYRPKGPWYLEFDPEGKPLDQVQLGGVDVQFHGRSPRLWCEPDYNEGLALMDEGQIVRRISRTPEGFWFRRMVDFDVAADGRAVAILHAPRMQPGESRSNLSIYGGEGEGRFSLAVPDLFRPSQVAVTNHWAAVTDFKTGVLLVNLDTREMIPIQLNPMGNSLRWDFSPNGRELWAVEVGGLKLHRFVLPE